MKCKKILAMLLALCMVLSTFVVVSAEDVVVIDIFEDYNDGIGDTICGGDITLDTEEFEGETALKVTSSYSGAAGWQSIVGFAVETVEGTHLKQSEWLTEGTIEYSFDIFVPEEGGNTGDLTVYLRTGNAFPPSGNMDEFDPVNGLVIGEWNTYSGTLDVSDIVWSLDTADDRSIWLGIRPNFSAAGTFYIDNFSFNVTQTVEEEEPELPPVSGDIEFTLAPKNVAGTLEDGVYTVTSEQLKAYSNLADFSDCSANDWLKIIPTTELDPEKTIKVSYEIKGENMINSIGQPYADRETTLRIRNDQNGNVVDRTTYRTMVPVNTGVAQLVEFEIPVADIAGYDHFGVSLDMMNALAFGDGSEYFEISNVAIEYVGEDNPGGSQGGGQGGTPSTPSVPDEPEEPADEITYTLTRNVNAGTNGGNAFPAVGEVNEDAFTATLRNVREYTVARNGDNEANYGGDCGYQPWVWIMLDEDLQTSEDWYVSFDLTTEGIINSIGAEYATLDVRTRFYNGDSELCGNSDHKMVVDANSGEPVNVGVQVDTSKVTGAVTKIGVAVDVGTSVKYNTYEDSDAYFTIDNFEVAMGEYVAPEVDEPVEPEIPPVTPEEPIFTTQIPVGNVGSNVTTEADGVYKVTVADVYDKMTEGTTNSYNSYVAIIPTTPIALDEDWTVTYDLKTNGLNSGSANIWLRLLDNTTTAAQGKTLGYVKQSATKADGTVTYTFTSEDIENGGGSSPATEIAAIYITFDMTAERAAYAEAPFDGYIEFSNISFEYGLPESEEPDEPVVPPVNPDEPEEPSEPGEIEYFNVIEINAPLDDASEITMIGQNVTVENATDIGGRSNVVKASGVGDSNNNIVGLKIGGSDFAFQPGDKIRYSVDVYTENSTVPNIWIRRHTGGMEPFNTNFKPALGTWEANTWRTITHECAYENLGTYDVAKAPQGWATPGDYALYLRANLGTVYLDNFSITVEREFVATIESVELVEAGADNATFKVTADGAIDIDTIAATIDGVEVDVTVEAIDELNTLVTVTGLAPNAGYTFAVTGAKNPNNRDVTVADEAACTVEFETIAEVDAVATLSGDTFTYSLTSNLTETETIYVVLLRCKGNTVIETTVATPVEAEAGVPVEGSVEVPELGADEYYRFFAWTYEDGAINSMANLINLD